MENVTWEMCVGAFNRVKEEVFWRNYFYRVSLVKQSAQLTALAAQQQQQDVDERGASVSPEDVILTGRPFLNHMLITNAKHGDRRKLLLKKQGLSHEAKNAFYQHPINAQLTKQPTFILLINYSGWWQYEM